MRETALPPGVWPVMLTPFHANGSIDWVGLETLVEWSLQAGVAGIFAVAQSAEVLHLTDQEKTRLASTIVRRVAGRVPVVASGYTTGTLEEQATFCRRVADTGAAAVVISTCQISAVPVAEDAWRAIAERLLRLTGDVPLGLYEMPLPYHHLLAFETMQWACSTGRFLFHKDTCCNSLRIRRKIDCVRHSRLAFYNADTPTLLDSLMAGADGFSGIGANYVPELYVWLCGHFRDEPEKAAALQSFLTAENVAMHRHYPASAKLALRLQEMPISTVCRTPGTALEREDEEWIAGFLAAANRKRLDLLKRSESVRI